MPQSNPQIDYRMELDKLFHYSTPGGFAGVLASKSLWMTNIHYQNDIKEYDYAIELILKVLGEEYTDIPYHGIFKGPDIAHIYTFSLTEENDLLSQWRGYSPDGGFAFSFEKEMLAKTMERHKIELIRCVYDEEEQKQFIRTSIIGIQPHEWDDLKARAAKVNYAQHTDDGNEYYKITHSWRALGLTAAKYAPSLKHPKFAEEKEWRLVKDLSITSGVSDYLRFRSAKDIIIPYLAIPLTEGDEQFKLTSVKVSPGPRQYLAEQACKLVPIYDVSSSNIPYRNW